MAQSAMKPAVHNIGLFGLTGVIFAVLTSALVLYLEGFVTTSWAVEGVEHEGLWQKCTSKGQPAGVGSVWLISSQVFASLGLIGVITAFGLAVIYMTGNRASKNRTLVALAAISLIAAVFICVSIGVYGVHGNDNATLSWSYYVTLVSAILCVLAGILSIVKIRISNVHL